MAPKLKTGRRERRTPESMTLPAAAAERRPGIRREWQSRRALLPALVAFATLVGLAFTNGGFFPRAWTTTAVALLWLVALALLLGARVELGAVERGWLAFLAVLVGWTALSASWSVSPPDSFLETRRTLVYLAGIAAVLVFVQRGFTAHLVLAVWAAGTVVVAYALARYLSAPRIQPSEIEGNLLFRPLGYANALGILAGAAAILAVVLTVRARIRVVRTLAAASVAPLAAALTLTSSRASALALVVGLGAMLLIDRDRLELIAAMLLLVPAGAAVVALSAHSRLTDLSRLGAGAEREAHRLGLWILLVAVGLGLARPAVGKAVPLLRLLPRLSRRVAVGALAAAAIAGVTVFVVHLGAHFFATGYRASYWHVAWREYIAHPWLGSGAGTFGSYWLRYGIPGLAGGALDAHNLYLETLAELGPLGLALVVGALGLPLVSAVRSRSDVFTSAAAGGYVAILAHAALDWDWEMPAVMLAGLVCAAALVAARRPDVRTYGPGTGARATALALAIGLAAFALVAQFVPALGGSGPQ